ncbi:MAG: thioredoxin family protein [Planctomycetota bacterium]
MQRTRQLILVVLAPVLVLAALAWANDQKQVEQRIPWQSDVFKAMEQARDEDKPLMVFFTAEWCAPCKEMKRTLWIDDEVVSAAENVVPVMIDVDAQPELWEKFLLRSLPTTLLIGPDGVEAQRFVGPPSSDQLISNINALASK